MGNHCCLPVMWHERQRLDVSPKDLDVALCLMSSVLLKEVTLFLQALLGWQWAEDIRINTQYSHFQIKYSNTISCSLGPGLDWNMRYKCCLSATGQGLLKVIYPLFPMKNYNKNLPFFFKFYWWTFVFQTVERFPKLCLKPKMPSVVFNACLLLPCWLYGSHLVVYRTSLDKVKIEIGWRTIFQRKKWDPDCLLSFHELTY